MVVVSSLCNTIIGQMFLQLTLCVAGVSAEVFLV